MLQQADERSRGVLIDVGQQYRGVYDITQFGDAALLRDLGKFRAAFTGASKEDFLAIKDTLYE